VAFVELHRCDMCGKTCENRYMTKGWIWFSSPISTRKSLGNMNPNTRCYEALGPVNKKAEDFCTITCLSAWLDLDPNSSF